MQVLKKKYYINMTLKFLLNLVVKPMNEFLDFFDIPKKQIIIVNFIYLYYA